MSGKDEDRLTGDEPCLKKMRQDNETNPTLKHHEEPTVPIEKQQNEEEEDDEDDDDDDNVNRYWPLPNGETIKSTISYQGKTISALAINNAGTKYAVGSHDCEVKLLDFERPGQVKSVHPCGQTVIKNIEYAPNDEIMLIISESCQAAIIGKDGQPLYQSVKGDQYIRDMTHTKGHVQMLNDGCFHRKDRNIFVTSSNDGTLRIWNLNNSKLAQENVIKVRSPISGLKATPNVCRFSRDSLTLATGCNDGSVMMWDTRRKYVTTSACLKNAHLKGSEIIGMDFSYNLTKLCTRSEDDTCKLWDLRNLKQAIATKTGVTTLYSNCDCVFSPDDRLIIAGTSGSNKSDAGELQVFDADKMELKTSVKVDDGAVVRSRWHPKINHIAYTTSSGSLFIAYDKTRSLGGLVDIKTHIQRQRKD